MFQLLLSAYSTISIKDAARFLGTNEDDAIKCKFLPLLVYGNAVELISSSCLGFPYSVFKFVATNFIISVVLNSVLYYLY